MCGNFHPNGDVDRLHLPQGQNEVEDRGQLYACKKVESYQ